MDQLLKPSNMFSLLLLTDVVKHINRFSKYLQTENLIFATVTRKFIQIKEAVLSMKENERPSFKELFPMSRDPALTHLLRMSRERMALTHQLGQNYRTEDKENIAERMAKFNLEIKQHF